VVSARTLTLLALALPAGPALAATESIEFVQEHLAEIVMDNRYATLPIWGSPGAETSPRWQLTTQAAFAKTHTGELNVDGSMFSLGVSRNIAENWRLTGFAFFDDLKFSSGVDQRPLEVQFADGVPLSLPAEAQFTGLDGTEQSYGLGLAIRRSSTFRLWHAYEWTAGVLWHHVSLQDYAFDFQILEGPSTGATGVVDYSATYTHVAPFFGIAWPRVHDNWRFTPHVQAVVPLPRRGVVGHIEGPGYDLRGDTGETGVGTPFGDPSVTIGLDVTYRPWNLTVDLGTAISQALLEPVIHKGVASNWLISVSWSF
jgi:hypothetical protein